MIRASFLTLSLLLPLMVLSACDDGKKDAPAQQKAAALAAAPFTVSGEMTYLQRIALQPGSVSIIKIRNDSNGSVVFEQRTDLNDKQVPIAFTLDIPRDRLVADEPYSLHIRIEKDNELTWTSEATLLDITAPNATLGMIRLQQARAESPAETSTEIPATRVIYMCGEKEVHLNLSSAGAELILDDGVVHALKDAVSASGAKYEAIDTPGLTFWSKGNTALITQDGQDWPECVAKMADAGTAIPADTGAAVEAENPAQITGITWLLEDLNGGGIIDGSHMTLLLDDAGRASGHSGCNRYTAGYDLNETTLSIKPNAAMTMMACAEALMEQEKRFIDALVLVTDYRFDETGALILGGGDKTLKFRVEAQEAPAAPQETSAP